MNNITITGRLTRDPELRYVPSGTAVSTFTLAVDRGLSKEKKTEAESNNHPTADFINIVVWGKMGENAANFLAKGRLVGIIGRLQSRSYEAKDSTKRFVVEVVASQVEFLERGDKSNSNDNSNSKSSPSSNSSSGYDDYNYGPGFGDNDDIPF